jgi:ubiquitin conjugation factor E4 A
MFFEKPLSLNFFELSAFSGEDFYIKVQRFPLKIKQFHREKRLVEIMSETNPFETLVSPEKTNEIIENVLLITLNPANPKNLHLMNDDEDLKLWTLEKLEFDLFERLMSLAYEGGNNNDSKVIIYLYNSFIRLQSEIRKNKTSEVTNFIKSIVFRNAATALKQPDLYVNQNISDQILEIYKDSEVEDPALRDEFLSFVIKTALSEPSDDDSRNVKEIIYKCFDECLKSVRQASMVSLEKWILTFLTAFSNDKNNPEMANLFLDYITLPPNCDGVKYADSLLGNNSIYPSEMIPTCNSF